MPPTALVQQIPLILDVINNFYGLSSTWDHYFAAATAYYAEQGNLKVPKRYVNREGLCLVLWIQRQRDTRKDNSDTTLSMGQIEKLDSIGMIWESKSDFAWRNGFEHARQYWLKKGQLNVESTYVCEDRYTLGTWIRKIRQQKNGSIKNTILTNERVEELEAIGMKWTIYEDGWEMGFQEAERFFKVNGHLLVPGDYRTENGFALGHWLSAQRQAKNDEFGSPPAPRENNRA